MKDEGQMYLVTEVGGFGGMQEFQDNDPTLESVDGKKKRKTMEELMREAVETNRKNLIK